jgi:hypothetical protein
MTAYAPKSVGAALDTTPVRTSRSRGHTLRSVGRGGRVILRYWIVTRLLFAKYPGWNNFLV